MDKCRNALGHLRVLMKLYTGKYRSNLFQIENNFSECENMLMFWCLNTFLNCVCFMFIIFFWTTLELYMYFVCLSYTVFQYLFYSYNCEQWNVTYLPLINIDVTVYILRKGLELKKTLENPVLINWKSISEDRKNKFKDIKIVCYKSD